MISFGGNEARRLAEADGSGEDDTKDESGKDLSPFNKTLSKRGTPYQGQRDGFFPPFKKSQTRVKRLPSPTGIDSSP